MALLDRKLDIGRVQGLLAQFPVVAMLGARQVGKTTLTLAFEAAHRFDLENPRDLVRLENPMLALESLRGLIVIDEIQRVPELFPVLRHLVDSHPEQRYLILGSASRDLIRQSSESLAGRIAYFELGGFRLADVGTDRLEDLWLRGAYPQSLLAVDDEASVRWRDQYVTTFLERDIPQLGVSIPANTLRRFWMMLSHYHGQILNYSELGRSFGISDVTVRRYLDLLEGTFMVRQLQPWFANVGKRVVKRPKLYVRDSGLFHRLQSINKRADLATHPKLGASWEGFALEVVARHLEKAPQSLFFWATHAGGEIDLFWQADGKNYGCEFKFGDAPRLTKSMKNGLEDLRLTRLFVICPFGEPYALTDRVSVIPLARIHEAITPTIA